jgi:sulfur-oxidizing protein SoxY
MTSTHSTRRDVLAGAGALAGMMLIAVRPSHATPASMQEAIRKVIGEAQVRKGRIAMEIPALVENGNVVPLTVAVESPMTAADHVKSIHVFNEKNPQPNVIDIKLGSRAGKATVSTRIRLADAQKVVVIAQMSDGSFWQESADVIVTLAACLEGSI